MIHIVDKQQCCGCGACVQRCPRQCITLCEDSEGFLYPKADSSTCINCGLCEKVCPVLHPGNCRTPLHVYAAKNKNEGIRMMSSSGGIFTLLAEQVISEGGVVFGARFDEYWEVRHDYVETVEALAAFRGSKYVQSRIENTYAQAEQFLKQGRKVLFSGTPCQIAGLNGFLRKEYENLLTVDVVCHGVPSPKVWRMYLDELIARKGVGKNTALSPSLHRKNFIRNIKFRSKSTGWKRSSFALTFVGATADGEENPVLLSSIFSENLYIKAFLADLILRPSCYKCVAKQGRSRSDLTIADYWGIHLLAPDFDDDKGTSLLLINTEKGHKACSLERIEYLETSLKEAQRYNGGFNSVTKIHPKRAFFYNMLEQKCNVIESMEKILRVPFGIYIYRRSRSFLGRLKKRIKK